jgi:flagellin-like protein
MKFTRNEDAVSPVIGVILMVAITVILAAVIAAFVFGMAGNINKTKVVAATASQQGATIWVTYQGGQDSTSVDSISATVDGHAMDTSTLTKSVGSTASYHLTTGETSAVKNHVVAIAKFSDGTDQVILDTYV